MEIINITELQYNWFVDSEGIQGYETVRVGYIDPNGVETLKIVAVYNGTYKVYFSDDSVMIVHNPNLVFGKVETSPLPF